VKRETSRRNRTAPGRTCVATRAASVEAGKRGSIENFAVDDCEKGLRKKMRKRKRKTKCKAEGKTPKAGQDTRG